MSAFSQKEKGSLTAEASLVMSFFLLSVNLLFYFFFLMEFQTEVQFALERVVRTQAIYCADTEAVPFAVSEEAERELAGISLGKAGISFVQNESVPEILDVSAVYEAGPVLSFLGPLKGQYLHRSRRRLWNGQEKIYEENRNAAARDETYVYITQNGIVYHRDRGCTYLSLSIRPVIGSMIAEQRNAEGERYRPCETCVKSDRLPGLVYITKTGNRYHRTRTCAGLRRWIIKVPLSENGGRRECSRCGG